MSIQTKLDEIKKRCDAAVYGPWDVLQIGYNKTGPRRVVFFSKEWGEWRQVSDYEPTMQFIAHARTDLPALAQALEVAVKALEEIKWNKVSRERLLVGNQDQRVASAAFDEINALLK